MSAADLLNKQHNNHLTQANQSDPHLQEDSTQNLS